MSPLGPADRRAALAETSLQCFAYGLLSLVPLLGLPFCLLALRRHLRTWGETSNVWNPGERYLLVGFCFAWLGGLINVGAVAGFVLVLMQAYGY